MANPKMEQADRACVYYDRRVNRWSTLILKGEISTTERWPTEAEARAHLGLEGGSHDPQYIPPMSSLSQPSAGPTTSSGFELIA